MPRMNNPAGRLLAFLENCDNIEISSNANTERILCLVFNLTSGEDQPHLFRKLGEILKLPSAIAHCMSTVPDINYNAYIAWLPELNAALGRLVFSSSWYDFSSKITAPITNGLTICDDILARHLPPIEIAMDDLNQLLEETRSLSDEVIKANIPESLREYLLHYLDLIDRAISDYQIIGPEALKSIVQNAIGACVLNPVTAKTAYDSNLGKRLWTLLQRLAVFTTLSDGLPRLASKAMDLLDSSGGN